MRNFWNRNGGIYLGYAGSARPTLLTTAGHIGVIGPNGSGKSRRFLIPNLLNTTAWTAVVIDIKGELYEATAAARRRRGSRIVRINPFDVLGVGSDGCNPLAAVKVEGPGANYVDDITAHAEAMCPVPRKTSEPFFASAGQDIIAGPAIYSRLTQKMGGSYPHVRQMLGQASLGLIRDIKAMMRFGEKHCPELYAKVAPYRDLGPDNRELNSILATARTATRWLDSPAIKNDMIKPSTFDFACLKDEPTTVYIILPAERLATHSGWLDLLLTSMLQGLLRNPKPGKVPVLLAVDEARQIKAPLLERAMPILRGYGVKMITVWQDAPQAELALGREQFRSYLANMGCLLAFGPQDPDTAKLLCERAGHRTAAAFSYRPGGGGLSIGPTRVPLLQPQDLYGMEEGHAICFTHQHDGPIFSYLPDPTIMPETKEAMARNSLEEGLRREIDLMG